MQDIISILNINVSFSIKTDKKALSIIFDEKLFDYAEKEKMLFISLSYLLMQFLKKKYKKKLRGYHLILTSKKTPASVEPNTNYRK